MSKHYPLPPDFWPGKPKNGLSVQIRVRSDASPQAKAAAMATAMRKLARLMTEEGLFNELRDKQHFKPRTVLRREREHAARRREEARIKREELEIFGDELRKKPKSKKRPTSLPQNIEQTDDE
jgi:ribosomal protein S21